MNGIGEPERATQDRVIALFREELGCRFLGDWSDRPDNSNIEEHLLTAYLEYLVVHELVDLLEPTHSARFIGLMHQFLSNWQSHRQSLNRLPVRHESWSY
jgi:hypothetical protein